jgi:hypothetical protein
VVIMTAQGFPPGTFSDHIGVAGELQHNSPKTAPNRHSLRLCLDPKKYGPEKIETRRQERLNNAAPTPLTQSAWRNDAG